MYLLIHYIILSTISQLFFNMNNQINLNSYSVVFLSYDEPAADEHYDILLSYIPWAQRVHGIKGSDTAHKECAKLSSTERVIIIDGDNKLTNELFFQQQLLIDCNLIDINNSVISWPSKNIINNLEYGNGGIKCWPTELITTMKTHELADASNIQSQIDFCWDINYVAVDVSYSSIINNSTPYQAWRAGFREGVKLSLNEGIKIKSVDQIWSGNLNRLLIWMTVGADILNGKWAILGATYGCWLTLCTNWNYVNVRDFDEIYNLFSIEKFSEEDLDFNIEKFNKLLKSSIPVPLPFTVEQSKFFKRFNFNQSRQHPGITIL